MRKICQKCQFFALNLQKFTPAKKNLHGYIRGIRDKYEVCALPRAHSSSRNHHHLWYTKISQCIGTFWTLTKQHLHRDEPCVFRFVTSWLSKALEGQRLSDWSQIILKWQSSCYKSNKNKHLVKHFCSYQSRFQVDDTFSTIMLRSPVTLERREFLTKSYPSPKVTPE